MESQTEEIYHAYTRYVLVNKRRPMFLFRFLEFSNIEETRFRSHFSSCVDLEKKLWLEPFSKAIEQIQSEEVYQNYSVREKFLALYFTWLEYLKEFRAFADWSYNTKRVWELWPSSMNLLKKHFIKFSNELVCEGMRTQEVADRPVITDYYANGLWLQVLFILKFWLRDKSQEFENTDAAIEKAVNFSMDLINSNAADSFMGLSKFIVKKW